MCSRERFSYFRPVVRESRVIVKRCRPIITPTCKSQVVEMGPLLELGQRALRWDFNLHIRSRELWSLPVILPPRRILITIGLVRESNVGDHGRYLACRHRLMTVRVTRPPDRECARAAYVAAQSMASWSAGAVRRRRDSRLDVCFLETHIESWIPGRVTVKSQVRF